MIDYAEWLHRAEDFVRGLNYLPGQWGISLDVEPPLPKAKADELREVLPLGLPSPLYDLYTTGAATYRCTYHWSPDQSHLPLVGRVFPHTYTLHGGAQFIPAFELKDWQISVRKRATGYGATADAPPRPGWETWYECVPFLAVGNGDYLALRVSDAAGRLPVLYLCHDALDGGDGRTAFEISPSFDRFLADWESLYYIGPAIWLLAAFLAHGGEGPLNVKQPKAALWRRVISGRRKP